MTLQNAIIAILSIILSTVLYHIDVNAGIAYDHLDFLLLAVVTVIIFTVQWLVVEIVKL